MALANHRQPRTAASDWLGQRSVTSESPEDQSERLVFTLEGWKRHCLFGVLISLTVIVLINLSLTLWLIRSLQLNSEGIGSMKIRGNGIHIKGAALILDSLTASQISSTRGRPLLMDSSQNITLTARDDRGRISNQIFLGDNRLEVQADDFRILNSNKEILFSANKQEVHVGAEVLRVSGIGGSVFEGSIQTPLIRAEPGNDLRLESITRSVLLHGPLGVAIDSRAGSIRATCLEDIKLRASSGMVKIDASSIVMPNLKIAPVSATATTGNKANRTFQVCVCSNGRLFLSPPEGSCIASSSVCS